MRQRRCVPVAKRVCLLTLLNCSLATCFAAGVHINLQLLKVIFFNKPSYLLIYSYTVSALSQASANLQLRGAMLSTKLTLNMITVILDRSASNYVAYREMPLQARSHKMLLR